MNNHQLDQPLSSWSVSIPPTISTSALELCDSLQWPRGPWVDGGKLIRCSMDFSLQLKPGGCTVVLLGSQCIHDDDDEDGDDDHYDDDDLWASPAH